MAKTYPCVVGSRIVELTAEQRASLEWSRMADSEKINVLMQRIQTLEDTVKSLQKQVQGPSGPCEEASG